MLSVSHRKLFKLILASAVAFFSAQAGAQDVNWPTRPVRFIVPSAPGSSPDALARLVGAKLSAALGQQFIVDNRPGGSTSIGTGIAARAAPDGYTFLFVSNTYSINPSLIPNLPYDTQRDLAPVMLVGTTPTAIATAASKPYKSFSDVIKAAKAKPDTVTYGSIGSSSHAHLIMVVLQQLGGFKLVHVPFKGGGPMTTDAVAGHVELGSGSIALLAPHLHAGRLRGIAVTGDKRSHVMPEVPALTEQGFPGFSALAWWGIVAPAATPAPIVNKFHSEVAKAFNQPDVHKQLTDQFGMDLIISRPGILQKFLAAEIERWAKVIRENNIRPE
jgi:tripartite-type tricarboxylate transporter receptor subunit TctC